MKNFYYLRIPKTNSSYFKNIFFNPIKEHLAENNVEVLNFGDHEGWGPVQDNTYKISIFADPVKRTVSHYCHYSSINNTLEDYQNQNKENLFKWIQENASYISDFQSKNIIYEKSENLRGFGWLNLENPDLLNMEIDKELLIERVSSIEILFKSSLITSSLLTKASEKIFFDLNVSNKELGIEDKVDSQKTSLSQHIYYSLTNEEKNLIYDYNKNDSDIYFNSEYFV
jgi:hypothetical protein